MFSLPCFVMFSLPCLGKKQLHKQSFQLHSIISVSHSYYRKKTGMKVYSSDINIDVNGSEQNGANPLLKVTGDSNNVCRLRCFTTRWRQGTVKNVFISESFIQEIHSKTHLTVFGCYRPPSASNDAISSLMHSVTSLNYKELVLLGDFNVNWLQSASDGFKAICDTLNLFQLVESPTRPNLKDSKKSTLIDLIFSNAPHKYSLASVYANDVSDYCVIAIVRDTKWPKHKPRIITRRCLRHFNEQGFLLDIAQYNWDRIFLIPDVESAWIYFYDGFISIINRHAPFKKFSVKGRDNPWFSEALSALIRERDVAWAKARPAVLKVWYAYH